jgi:hypothetical protein
MAERTLGDEFDRFRAQRDELVDESVDLERRERQLAEGAVLAAGILIGGGFPGAAACVTVLLELRFPEVDDWPWLSRKRPL